MLFNYVCLIVVVVTQLFLVISLVINNVKNCCLLWFVNLNFGFQGFEKKKQIFVVAIVIVESKEKNIH
jgi:hypothetical protein